MTPVQSRLRGSSTRSRAEIAGGRQLRSTSAARAADGSLLFAEDVAAVLGMTRDWVYAETRAGRIPHVTLGRYYRYRAESIEAWLREIEDGSARAPGRARRRP